MKLIRAVMIGSIMVLLAACSDDQADEAPQVDPGAKTIDPSPQPGTPAPQPLGK